MGFVKKNTNPLNRLYVRIIRKICGVRWIAESLQNLRTKRQMLPKTVISTQILCVWVIAGGDSILIEVAARDKPGRRRLR